MKKKNQQKFSRNMNLCKEKSLSCHQSLKYLTKCKESLNTSFANPHQVNFAEKK